MKKLFSAIAIIASLIFSLSAMAMQSIGDNELSKVTGQSGVSLGLDATVDMSFGIIAWGDKDGIAGTAYTNAGWVGLANGSIDDLRIRPRIDAALATSFAAEYSAAALDTFAVALGYTDWANLVTNDPTYLRRIAMANQTMTIDVGTNSTGNTMVRIGLPTGLVTMTSMTADVGLWADATSATALTNIQKIGSLYVGGLTALIGRNSYVDISAHAGAGLTMDINVTIDSVNIDTVSYGDTDGLVPLSGAFAGVNTYAAGAGYVGLLYTSVAGIETDMTVAIDVATANQTKATAWLTALTTAAADNTSKFYAYKAAAVAMATAKAALVADPANATLLAAYSTAATSVATAYAALAADATEAAYITPEYQRNFTMASKSGAGMLGATWVNLGLNGSVHVDTLSAYAALGTNQNLMASPQILGTLYASNLDVKIGSAANATANSWLSINAH